MTRPEGDQPLVSVCIPAYNNADTIAQTMACVQRQTYPNLELIVVDDASADGTAQAAERASDYRTILRENTQNLGMAGNWNRCLSLCRGTYIKLLCADDLIDPDLIRREVELLEADPDLVMVSSDTRFLKMDGSEGDLYRRYPASGKCPGRKVCRFSLFTRDYLGAPLANTFRRADYERFGGFDPSFSYIIDYDFYMRLAEQGDLYILHEPLNFFRLRARSNTTQVLGGAGQRAYIEEHARLVRKHAAALGLSKPAVWLSVQIRRLTCVLGGLYMRLRSGSGP